MNLGVLILAVANWTLPLPTGEPLDIVVVGQKAFVANGSGGLMCLSIEDDRLNHLWSASTSGSALRVLFDDHNAYVYTSLSNLEVFNADGERAPEPVRLGAWQIVNLTIYKKHLFYIRKVAVEKRRRTGERYFVDLYFVGKALLKGGTKTVIAETPLGAMRAYEVEPFKGGELVAVSLGNSGIAIISFLQKPPRIIDYIVNVGDIRALGAVPERFILAGSKDSVVAIDIEKYLGATAELAEPQEIDLELEAEEKAPEKQVFSLALHQRPLSFHYSDHILTVVGTRGISIVEVPELDNELIKGRSLTIQARSALKLGKKFLWADGKSRVVLADETGKNISMIRTDLRIKQMVLSGRQLLVATAEQLWDIDPENGKLITSLAISADFLIKTPGGLAVVAGKELLEFTTDPALKMVSKATLRSIPTTCAVEQGRFVYAEGPRDPDDGFDRLWEITPSGERLLAKVEGRITAVAVEGNRTLFSATDVVATSGRRPIVRSSLQLLEGNKPLASASGKFTKLVLRGDTIIGFNGRSISMLGLDGKEIERLWRIFANDISQFEFHPPYILCCGWRGFRSYELRNGEPYYVARSRLPSVRLFAVEGESLYTFSGNRLQRTPLPPLALPQSGFVLAEGGLKKGKKALQPSEVASEYGKSYRILDRGIDVTSEAYEHLRGYRLEPVYLDLSGKDWQKRKVDPDQIAIDPKSGRIKFSDGSPCLMERISQVAGIMYNSAGFDIRDDRIYIALGENANPFIIYDISDYAFPKQLGLCPGGVRFPHDIAVDDQMKYAYFPVTYGGLEITRVDEVLGSAYEMIKKASTVVTSWQPPGAGKTFKLELTSGGKKVALRLALWRPPAGGSPVSAEVVGDICYVSNRGGFFFVLDISDREKPALLGQCQGGGGIVSVENGYAYLSSGGLTIIDVHNPRNPRVVGRLSEYDGKYLSLLGAPYNGLICMGEWFRYGAKNFYLVSIRDPSNPSVLGFYEDPSIVNSTGAQVLADGKTALLIDAGSSGSDYNIIYGWHSKLILLDISEPEKIKPLSVFKVPDEGDYRGLRIDYRKNLAYIGDRSFGVWFYDISDPSEPVLLGGVPASGEADFSYFYDNHLFFDTTAGGAFWAVDFSDPQSPKKVGYFWDGVWTARTTLRGKDGVIYAPLNGYGLKVLDARNPSAIRLAKELRLNIINWAYDIDGDRLYALAVKGRAPLLKVYDLSKPLDPQPLADLPLRGVSAPAKIDASGSRLYIASLGGFEKLLVYELDKTGLNPLGELSLAGVLKKEKGWDNWKLQVVGGRAYIFGDGLAPNLSIIDVSDPERMRVLFANPLDTRGRPMDFTVSGDYLYANWYYPGVQVYDTTDPTTPIKLATEPSGPGGEFSKDAWSCGQVSGPYIFCPKLSFAVCFTIPRSTQAPLGKVELQLLR